MKIIKTIFITFFIIFISSCFPYYWKMRSTFSGMVVSNEDKPQANISLIICTNKTTMPGQYFKLRSCDWIQNTKTNSQGKFWVNDKYSLNLARLGGEGISGITRIIAYQAKNDFIGLYHLGPFKPKKKIIIKLLPWKEYYTNPTFKSDFHLFKYLLLHLKIKGDEND